jgi:hypothetical protein
MRKLFEVAFIPAEAFLILVGVIATYFWAFQGGQWEPVVSLSAGLLAIILFITKVFLPPPAPATKDDLQNVTNAQTDELEKRFRAILQDFRTAEKSAKDEPAVTPSEEPDQFTQQLVAIVRDREFIESKLRQLAAMQNIPNVRQNTPNTELLSRVRLPQFVKEAIGNFFQVANDLVHQPKPLISWAEQDGKQLIDTIKLFT